MSNTPNMDSNSSNESNETGPVEGEIPSPELLTLMRIYDILLLELTMKNQEAANKIIEAHLGGSLVGPVPNFNGVFITNEINE